LPLDIVFFKPFDSHVKCCLVTAEPRNVIQIADDGEDELQRSVDPAAPSPTEPVSAPDLMTVELTNPPQAPVSQAPVSQAPVSQAPVLLTVSLLPLKSTFSLYRVPEDQTGAAKEAMIQAEHMMRHTKEAYEASKLAYDASSALRANVRVSALVSSFLIVTFFVYLDLTLHPLGVSVCR
jgi:hypothetical protein